MAMDHAALLEVLEALKSAGVDERIKIAATTIYQALIDAELTSVIGAGPWETLLDKRASSQSTHATVARSGPAATSPPTKPR